MEKLTCKFDPSRECIYEKCPGWLEVSDTEAICVFDLTGEAVKDFIIGAVGILRQSPLLQKMLKLKIKQPGKGELGNGK